MKIEFYLNGPNKFKWFNDVYAGYMAAQEADDALDDAKWERLNAESHGQSGEVKTDLQPEPVKAEPAKRASRKKAEEPAPEPEQAAQITASPEDRKPVEEIEEAEVVDPFEEAPAPKVYTRQDVKDAMQRYVAKHGMDALAANAPALLGAKKLSEIPEDAAAFGAAAKRLEAAIA